MKKKKDAIENILFAVTGFSPAVITETVWALAHEKPSVIPSRVVVLTTAAGKETLKTQLFTPCSLFKNISVWEALRNDLSRSGHNVIGKLGFGLQDINVFFSRNPRTGTTVELSDILTPEDNAAMADQILEHLRRFTENPQTRVIASIAGGRKTMGALLFACMSLIGRETDRITHVLVNAPYDDPRHVPRFYFPVSGRAKAVPGPKPNIMLANIPFVPLRNRFKNIGSLPGGYNRLAAECSEVLKAGDIAPVKIAFDDAGLVLSVDNSPLKRPARLYFLLRYLVDINERKAWPVKQEAAVDDIKNYLHRNYPAQEGCATPDGDELRKRFYSLRHSLAAAGIHWSPGHRDNSLHLPPFQLKK